MASEGKSPATDNSTEKDEPDSALERRIAAFLRDLRTTNGGRYIGPDSDGTHTQQ